MSAKSQYPLEFENVSKEYGLGVTYDSLRDVIPAILKRLIGRNGHANGNRQKFWALKDVNFHVKKGETLGIIGPNGAGKSTVLKLLSQICKQTSGNIHVNGRLAALIEVGAGFHPDLTGRENIYLNGTIMGLKRKRIDALFQSIVEFSELEKFMDMPVKRYSSGMSVRLGFSVAAHINPDILLIDEVLSVGDLAFQQKCFQRILDLKAQGTTIIFISHNLESVQRLCDRAVLLDHGTVKGEGDPATVIEKYRREVLANQKVQLRTPDGLKQFEEAKDIMIEQLQLVDAKGEVNDVFQTAQPLQARIKYRTVRPIQDPSISVIIERMDGVICNEASSKHSNLSWQSWSGEGSVTIRYPKLNLLPGTYQVMVAIFEGQNPVPLAQLNNQVYFHINSDRLSTRGTVYLEHKWQSENNGSH